MKARSQNEALGPLEQALESLYHSPEPDPEFIRRLEQDILTLDFPAGASKSTGLNWWDRIPQPAQMIIWGAAALLLILMLTWIFNYTIPQPVPGTQPVITHTTSPSKVQRFHPH